MGISFLPTRDLPLNVWAQNFKARISATPTAFGLVAGDATAFGNLATDYDTRLTTALDPSTRTKVTISAKDLSRAALKSKARALAKIVNAYPGTTNPMREDLGLHARDVVPTPTPTPTTKPVITLRPDGTMSMFDETTPTRRAKPAGVTASVVQTKLDGPPPVSPDDTKFAAVATRTSLTLDIPPGSGGKTLYVIARWMNDRGELGPVSAVASVMLAA